MGVRFVAAGLLMGLFLALRSGIRQFALSWKQMAGVVFMGTILLAMGNGLTSLGQLRGVPSGVAALIIATVPLWIALYRTVSGDRPPIVSLVGIGVGMAGLVYLVTAGPGVDGGSLPVVGVVIILISSVSWSFGSWIQPRIWLPRSTFVGATYQLLVAGTVMSIGALLTGETFESAVSPQTWGALAYLVLIGSIVGFTSYVWLLANAPVSLVATHAYVNPVVALFLGWLVLSEPITTAVLVGGSVVVLSVVLVVGGERKRPDVTRKDDASHPAGG